MKRTAVFGFYLALSIAFTAPVSLRPMELAVNDGDPLHISWILAWDAHQTPRDPLHLFDSNSFYPYRSSLAFSEHLLGPALLAAPFFYATGNALFAQNAAVVLTLALSAFAVFLMVREVFGSDIGALVAGTVYGFHSYNFHEVARLQLLSVQWWPLAVLFLHRTFVRGGGRNAFLAAAFFTLQGLSCTYYLFYFALALLIWIPVYTLTSEQGLRRAATLVAPFAAAGLVFALLGVPYLRMVRGFGFGRELAEGMDFGEYVRPPAGSLFSMFGSFLAFDPPPAEVPQFLGFVSLLLAALGLLRRPRADGPKSRVVFFWLSVSTAIVGAVLSLGPTVRAFGHELGPGPYAFLYDAVPFFRVLRNAERMSVLVHFGIAVAAGVGAESLAPGPLLRILLLVALPFEHFAGGQPFTRIPTGDLVPRVYRWLDTRTGAGAVVELPLYRREQLRLHALYMFYSTFHWKPIVFGRTSFYPPLTGYLGWEMRRFPDGDTIALLEGLSIETLVVHPNLWPPGERETKLALLSGFTDRLEPQGRFAPATDPSQVRYGFGDERVFRLRHAGNKPSTSDLCAPGDEIPPEGWNLRGDSDTPVEWIVDRNPETKWRTRGQLPGLKLEIDLGREETLSAVRLELGYPHDQFPRDLTLKARTEGGESFERIEPRDDVATRWELVQALVEEPSKAAVILRFPQTRARILRFWIREGKPWDFSLPDWSLPELHLYRECREPH